jgi:hypothetical protein
MSWLLVLADGSCLPPLLEQGRDQPPAAYFKEASYGSAQLASLSNRSRGRGSTITNADKKDLC